VGYLSFHYLFGEGYSGAACLLVSTVAAYLPTYLITYQASKKGGFKVRWFQKLPIFKFFSKSLEAKILIEEDLDHDKPYIFCQFPHGTCTLSHGLTMTDCLGMLTKIHRGDRRDLAASVLFLFPIVKEILLLLGCVDAGASTAHYNLKKGRSILIFVGGEKEQMWTTPGEHKIYLKNRKGFVKLALQYGVDLVPMYCFGEVDAYTTSKFLYGARAWLQNNFQICIPIFWGRYGTLIPHKGVAIQIEMGKPISVQKVSKEEITSSHIDKLHNTFCQEMKRLFERTKARHGLDKSVELLIE